MPAWYRTTSGFSHIFGTSGRSSQDRARMSISQVALQPSRRECLYVARAYHYVRARFRTADRLSEMLTEVRRDEEDVLE